jgi:uncharacterized repeat protein (TIGR01451 family)
LWKFHVDFVNPGNSYFNLTSTIPTDPFDSIFPCSPTSRECIPQPDTSRKIDILSYRQRPIWRLAYRNFGTHEVLVTNQSVEASTNMAGNRWYEIRDPNGTPFIYQQGTYAPGVSDGIHRWMASIAMDSAGNMAMGYSASNGSTTYPSVWYTGRLASDPLGEMAQGEGVIINGSGSQNGTSSRWGDYTSMNVDPVDDCTFWYINEYYPVSHSTNWRLRIGAFKFPTCGIAGPNADLEIGKSADPNIVSPGADITYTLTITNTGPYSIITDTVTLTDTLPSGLNMTGFSSPANWTCDLVGQTFTCSTSELPADSMDVIQIFAGAPAATGYITNTVELASTMPDPFTSNNNASVAVLVDTVPLAADDSFTASEDTTLNVPAPGVLDNDIDADGDALAASLLSGPSNGDLQLNSDGSFIYTPDPDFNGLDSFTYLVDDGFLTDEATVEIDVAPLNDAPVALDDSYDTLEDTPLVVPAPGVLDNDSDVDGDELLLSVVTPPVNGELALGGDGSFVYTPTLNFNGQDTFTYSVSDGEFTDQAEVAIDVTTVNDDPLADAGEDQTVDEGEELVLQGTVSDPGLNLAALDVLDISWDLGDGTLVTGTLTVTHAYADNGVYTVMLTADDSEGGVGVDTLLVTVMNVAPVMDEIADQTLTLGDALMLSAGFIDPGTLDTQTVVIDWGDGLTETLNLAAGESSFDLNHTYLEAGEFTVSIIITDKDGGSSAQTFTVTVEPSTRFMFIPLVNK